MVGKANLRISYIGGGYDFPKFFEHQEVRILSEGLPIGIECHYTTLKTIHYHLPKSLESGLGSSAARHLSMIRALFPIPPSPERTADAYDYTSAPFRDQVNAAIQLDGLQAGGWQDAIASAYHGLIKIVLHKDNWSVYPFEDYALVLHPLRKLYRIPVETGETKILLSMQCRETSFDAMQALVADGEAALRKADFREFGAIVREGWHLKQQWHPEITNLPIMEMEDFARLSGAWGWKVCGAGGQGYFLVIGDRDCHQRLSEEWTEFKVTHV